MDAETGRFFDVGDGAPGNAGWIPVDLQYQTAFREVSARLRSVDQGISLDDARAQARSELERLQERRRRAEWRGAR